MTKLTDPAILFRDPDHRLPAYELVERFLVTPEEGPALCGELFRPLGPNANRGRRRIVVRELTGGPTLFDTDDCYDLGNATNKLDLWLAQRAETALVKPGN